MRINACAKINIGLDITGKRKDGYHELNTLFCEVGLHDTIDIELTDEKGIFLSCTDETLSCGPDNLAYRAAELMNEKFKPEKGVRIHIGKNIPMGAGMGGGSSDAAAVLKGMNELFGFGADNDELRGMGSKLGADVPFFIEGGMAQAKGMGEKLVHMEKKYIPDMLLIKPGVSIPTGPAYKAVDRCENVFHPDIEKLIEAINKKDYDGVCRYAGNTFENAIFEEYPVIREIKERAAGLGADACVMTGSGSALFAFFKTEEEARMAKKMLEYEDSTLKLFLETGGQNEKK